MNLQPDSNIQAAIDINPPGTSFQLAAGLYRGQHFQPKRNDQFIGDPAGGTVLSGAIPLTAWTASGPYWTHPNLPAPLKGRVVAGSNPLASNLNDLFIDNTLYRRVGQLSQVTAGTWYFDPKSNAAVIATDPTGHLVEYSVSQSLVPASNKATGVVIRDLTVEKYATDAQVAPIHGIRNWRVVNVTSTQNHGAGLNIASGTTVQGGHFNHNGQIGINGWEANDTQVLGAEIAGNNYAGYNTAWEAGGLKLAGSSRVVISGNNVHDNNGQGLWSDIDDRDFIYTNNVVSNNTGNGIMYEISFGAASIQNNTITCNGGAGIYLSNSSGVDVSGNTILVRPANSPGSNGAAGAGGIDIINDVRDPGPNGPYQASDNNIHDNRITHWDDSAQDGIFIYRQAPSSNKFDHNVYYVKDANMPHWHADRSAYRWQAFVDNTGLEQHGEMLVQAQSPLPDSCHAVSSASLNGNGINVALLLSAAAIVKRRWDRSLKLRLALRLPATARRG